MMKKTAFQREDIKGGTRQNLLNFLKKVETLFFDGD